MYLCVYLICEYFSSQYYINAIFGSAKFKDLMAFQPDAHGLVTQKAHVITRYCSFTAFLFLHMIIAVDKLNGHGFSNAARREHLPKNTKVMWY